MSMACWLTRTAAWDSSWVGTPARVRQAATDQHTRELGTMCYRCLMLKQAHTVPANTGRLKTFKRRLRASSAAHRHRPSCMHCAYLTHCSAAPHTTSTETSATKPKPPKQPSTNPQTHHHQPNNHSTHPKPPPDEGVLNTCTTLLGSAPMLWLTKPKPCSAYSCTTSLWLLGMAPSVSRGALLLPSRNSRNCRSSCSMNIGSCL